MRVFEQAGWLGFLERFQGSDHDLALEFAQSFNGRQATVRRLNILVSEESISRITSLPLQGERWYKNFKIPAENWAQFLKKPSPLPDLRRGIHIEALCPHGVRLSFAYRNLSPVKEDSAWPIIIT
jgi:hypothetical protein